MNNKSVFIPFFIAVSVVACRGFDIDGQKADGARSIMEKIAQCQFDGARIDIDSMIARDSADPVGWMLSLSEIALRELDYARSSDSDSFQKTYERTETVFAAYEKRRGVDSYLLTAKGISQLIAAAYRMHRKKYLSALNMGFDALDASREAKKIDSANVDADFVVGLYGYARAELKRRFLGILFWYSGNKESGIRAIERCCREARLISLVAEMVLLEIYFKEGMDDKAEAGIGRFLASHPGNRFVLWTKAKFFERRKMPARAAEIYGMLADAYGSIPAARNNLRTTRLLEAQRYFEANEPARARDACARALSACGDADDDGCGEAEKLEKKIRNAEKKP